jgi:hypothetical protein
LWLQRPGESEGAIVDRLNDRVLVDGLDRIIRCRSAGGRDLAATQAP